MITLYWWDTACKAGQWLDAGALRDRAESPRLPPARAEFWGRHALLTRLRESHDCQTTDRS
jgi:hypothetical protein